MCDKQRKVYELLDMAISARKNCQKSDYVNHSLEDKWSLLIEHLEKNYLPYGSGFDAGVHVDEDVCVNGVKLVLTFDFHHMNEHGYYDGWTTHKAIITPYFDGIGVAIKGSLPKKYQHSREYFGDTIYEALLRTVKKAEIDKILTQGA